MESHDHNYFTFILCRKHIDYESEPTSQLEDLMLGKRERMNQNRLKMNSGNTEFILFGARQQVPVFYC